jgi:uroporphyrinogen-III synthase
MRVIVTRPEPEAARWAAALQARGFDAAALPLIDITPARNPAPVSAAWRKLADYQALMFVSGSAVTHFFEQNRPATLPAVAQAAPDIGATRAWATGPGTQAALLQLGLAPSQIDAPAHSAGQFDSEALWQLVSPHVVPGSRVLVVRGGGTDGESAGRSWLTEQLATAGAVVDTVVAYERHPPQFTPAQLALAQRATHDGSVWLLSSSEAIGNLAACLGGHPFTAAKAVATHPRIADAARAAGFGVVCSSRPTLDDVAASIESLI